MAIVINGSGTVTGLAVGGLPDGTVDSGTLATDSVVTGKIADGTIANADIADLAASKLTGALPAISGASLTGITTGKVLQVVNSTHTTSLSTSSTSYVDWASINITPSSTSNKLFAIFTGAAGFQNGTAESEGGIRILGNTTVYFETGNIISQFAGAYYSYGAAGSTWCALLTPASTSAVTVKLQIKRPTGNNFAINVYGNTQTITVMEIAG